MPFFKLFSRLGRRSTRVYLDYASSTPDDPKMRSLLPRIPVDVLGANSGALHKEAVTLKRYLSDARATVAKVLEVHSDEIIFTASATESDNLAILGMVHRWLKAGVLPNEILIVSSQIEHSAVRETIGSVVSLGVQYKTLPTEEGVINPRDIIVSKEIKAVFVSIMYVNNEIGVVQPIVEIAKRIRKLRKDHSEVSFIFHTDATQAPAHFSLRVPTLGVDMMTLGSTKLYCQKGVGLLYKKRGIKLEPIMYGGGQEFGLRPGTEPVALIHQFAHALMYAKSIREKETARVKELQIYFESQIKKYFPQLTITAKNQERTVHITHVAFPAKNFAKQNLGGQANFDSELLVLELDARGIAVSAKSACQNDLPAQSGGLGESSIVEKIYGKGTGAVRFSFGRTTTKKELDKAIKALGSVLQKYNK